MTFKYGLLIIAVGMAGCLLRLWHLARTGHQDMSLTWLEREGRKVNTNGIDGVAWNWDHMKHQGQMLRARTKP